MRFFLSFFWVAVLATGAWAYVPPAQKMLDTWFATYEKAPAVEIEGTLLAGAESHPFRVVATKDGFTYSQNGLPVTDSTSRFVFGALLRPARAVQTLRSRGLDLGATGLARVGDRIAWTIGVKGENQKGSQIWLDRATHTPLLLVYAPGGDNDVRITFAGYAESTSRLFPAEIKVEFEGGATRVYQLESLTGIK